MYFYHLKFELYVPSTNDQTLKLYDSISLTSRKETSENNNSSRLYFVPEDIFQELPSHQSTSDKNNLFLQRANNFNKSKTKSKARSKSVDQSKNFSLSEIPLIPPTPVSSVPASSSNKIISRRKSFASTSSFQPTEDSTLPLDKTHDFRFGNIEIEWFDNIEANMSEEQQNQTDETYANVINNSQNGNDNETNSPSESYLTTPISEDIQSSSTKKSKSKAVNPPAGKFVPLRSGKTNLSYGILHLYRDPKEIPSSNEDREINNISNLDNDNLKSSKQQESNSWKTVRDEKHDNFPGLVGINETILAVLAVPSYTTAPDFLGFVAPVRKYVSHLRFIRDSAPNKFIVLMKFRHARAARDFYKQFNGRPFSSMEPEICHVVYIKSIEFKSISTPPYAFPFLHDPFLPSSEVDSISSTQGVKIQQTTSPLHELPTCPVCLERMDASVTGLLTILCQHTFHCDCLSKWGDSSCPVCRYSQKRNYYDTSLEQNECGVCRATENLWICLVCELETQRVWDYAGDGYVHRLIQNKTDGKLVELPSPDTQPQLQQPRNDQVNQDKLDAIGLEYSYLLSTQLSSQRTYYEEKLDSVTLQLSKLTNQYQQLADEVSTLKRDKDEIRREKEILEKDKIPSLIKEKKSVEKKVEKFTEKSEKLERELRDEKEMTKSLLTKQVYIQTQLDNRDSKIKDLEEQIRDLMFFFQAQENPEIAGGDVIVSGSSNTGSGKKKRGKK
ncbi:unnamed protein product [Rhizophagus irregularis]|nr:unnamed protein product [Rhizophagus irregularis]CAB4407509.1 unnamed protein product [Rhizophagus irregularis]